jgi:hypothetical protein
MRRAVDALRSSQAPYARPIVRVVSHSSGKLKPNFFAKAALSSSVSKLMPKISTPFSSKRSSRSRNPQPSAVHPGVSAFG